MKRPRTLFSAVALLAALLTSAVPSARAITLEELLVPGAEVISGDKVFFEFHNVIQNGDLNVPLDEIFVDPIIGGPGPVESEFGIRFSSALWRLEGPNLHYDLGIDFHVRQASLGPSRITDNTLEITGGFEADGSAHLAEGVLDHITGATLVDKNVFFDRNGVKLQDHQVFPGGPYRELEISKDLALETELAVGSRVFVSHFDQTFSQPDSGPGTLATVAAFGLVLGLAKRARSKLNA
jgi:hypothetical protein